MDEYSDNDWLVKRKLSSHARKQSPSLPKEWYFRVIRYQFDGFPERFLATSLPKNQHDAAKIIELYHQRWEIELGYREIKCTMLRKAIALRSKKITLVYQELYGLLLAYNLIRYEMALAVKEAKVSPLRISFKLGFKVVLYDYTAICQTRNLQSIPARLKDLTDDLKDFILPKPDRPNYERSVKIRPNKYPLKSS